MCSKSVAWLSVKQHMACWSPRKPKQPARTVPSVIKKDSDFKTLIRFFSILTLL